MELQDGGAGASARAVPLAKGTTLYSAVESYYSQVARIALYENDVDFEVYNTNLQGQENLEPWFMRMNPEGLIPALCAKSGGVVNDSRNIVNWAYGSPESPQEKAVLDQLYSECPGSLAFLTGGRKICLLKVMMNSPAAKIILPKIIARKQAANPDLHEAYERKKQAMSVKHVSKNLDEVRKRIQAVVDWLEQQRLANGGPWLLGAQHSRADTVACTYLQWVTRVNEYEFAIVFPAGIQEYLKRAQERPAYQQAIGQHGRAAFVLETIGRNSRKAGCFCSVLWISILVAVGVASGVLTLG